MKKQIFTISLLDDKDYLKMNKQFSNIDEKDLHNSLGFADKESGTAFVRKTSVKDVDMAVVQHEIQELMSKTSEHEKDGIRFGFGDWVKKTFIPESRGSKGGILGTLAAIGLAPFTGGASLAYLPLAGAAGGAIGGSQEGDILGGALKGLAAGTLGTAGFGAAQGASAAGSGFLSKAGGAISGAGGAVGLPGFGAGGKLSALGGTKAIAPMAGGPLSTYAGGGSVLGSSLVAPTVKGAAGAATGAAAPWVAPAVKAAGGTPAAGPAALTPALGAAPGQAPKAATFADKLKGILKTAGTQAAISGVTGAMTPQPEFETPASIEELTEKISSGQAATSLGEAARADLLKTITSSYDELYPTSSDAYHQAVMRKTEDAYAKALEDLDKQYNLAGVYGTGEHMSARQEMQTDLANIKADLTATVESQNRQTAITAKYQAIQEALQVDRATMDDLIGISGLDVELAAQKYGADIKDVQMIREAIGNIGSEIMA